MNVRTIGGHLGQRERVLYTTWLLTFVWGLLRHWGLAADDSALTLLVTSSLGVVASYSYRRSAAEGSTPPPPAG